MCGYRMGSECANDYEKIRTIRFRGCCWISVHRKSIGVLRTIRES